MHFEVLVEDKSASIAVDCLLAKILGPNNVRHSWRTHAYKGAGHVPKGMRGSINADRRILLDRLPMLLRGYGRSLDPSHASVVVVVDADDRDCVAFKQDLLNILAMCDPKPKTLIRIAVEESEAWLLGDRRAVLTAYPRARRAVLDTYVQDSVCGTWEVLADAMSLQPKSLRWPESGVVKCQWAERITPHMDVDRNASPSFRAFRDGIRSLTEKH